MAGGKLSARQKMINMMYLVLTALLALNVSKEILKAFHLMEVSFNKANANVDKKNLSILKALEEQAKNRPEEVAPYHKRALEVKQVSGEFVKYIEELKKALIARTEGRKEAKEGEETGQTELVEADNIELHANYFFKNPDDTKAKELTAKVNATRAKLLGLLKDGNGVKVDPADRAKIEVYTNLKTNYDKTNYTGWAEMYFEHSPLAGVITMLTKIQNDCRNTEADIIEMLAKNIDKDKITFDRLEAKVIPNSTAVQVGSEYRAEVILVASNTKSDNPVMVGGRALPMEEGKGIYTARPSNQGVFSWSGSIEVKSPTGNKSYPFKQEYQAFEGGATISADAMNVLYIGLENPISISVSGYSPNDIQASITNGSLARAGKGGWVAKVTQTNPNGAVVSVSVKMKDGSTRKMGEKKYRIKSVPKPEPMYGTVESGSATAAQLMVQNQIRAVLPNFVFEGVTFTVTKYSALFVPKKGEARPSSGVGSAITPQLKGWVTTARRGDKVLIDDIYANGPGGIVKRLLPIVITIQ
jgi:gliding motility-associated protein GldM